MSRRTIPTFKKRKLNLRMLEKLRSDSTWISMDKSLVEFERPLGLLG